MDFLLHALSVAMPGDAVLVEEAAVPSPGDVKIPADARPGQFLHHGERRLGYGLPAAVGMALGRAKGRTVCLIGDGSAMYSIQALWTAAQRNVPLTVVVVNDAGYGAMRSFSQVMQVRNVPGLDLPGIDFVKIAEGHGLRRRACRANHPNSRRRLKRALAHKGTSLVEVMVDSAVPLLYAQKH